MIPQANQIYRHFKGNLYKVITTAVHTETEEELVIYQALYGDFKIYARPLSMFISEVDRVKYPDAGQKMRFEPIEQMVGTIVTAHNVNEAKQEEVINTEDSGNTKKEESQTAEDTKTAHIVQKAADREESETTAAVAEKGMESETTAAVVEKGMESETTAAADTEEETVTIDPLLEAYLDADTYRERLNILHGLQHRNTEHMLNTMAIVIDFELPEGDIQTKYYALNDCLLTKEKYECNRIF